MKNIEEINQTSDIFLSILEYCKKNNLAFWTDHKGYHYRMYLGGRTFFEEQVKNSDWGAFEITPSFINEEKLNLKFIPFDQNKTCHLQLWNPWAMLDTENHGYHLFFHCINSTNSQAIYEILFNALISKAQQSKISDFLNYGNFINDNIIDLEKWNQFLKFLSPQKLEIFWNNKIEVDLVSSLLKKVKNRDDVQTFIETIFNEDQIKTEKINDKYLNFSTLILENFSHHEYLKYYGEKYPFINQLLNKKEFFNFEDNCLEKSLINNFEISYLYPIKETNLVDYTENIILISQEISNHSKLKEIGLIEIDTLKKDFNTYFYLNIKKNSTFKKEHFEKILKEIIVFFNEKNEIHDVKETVDSFVQKWYLDNKFPEKINHIRKNKI